MSERADEPHKNCTPLAPRDLMYELVVALVDHPEDVWIETHESLDKKILTLIIHTRADDRGKIIGQLGSTMKLLKELMGRVAAARHMKIMLVVSESNDAEPPQ